MKKYENIELELVLVNDVIATSFKDDNSTEPDWE